jgi:Fe(3+) dicitrate transport protein
LLVLGLVSGFAERVAAQPAEGAAAELDLASGAEPEAFDATEPDAPEAALSEDEAEVTILVARLRQTAGSVHVLSQRQLERFEYDDAHSILGQVPGVYMRQEDGMGLRPNIGIRGGNPDRSKKITLMEDGVLQGPAPYSASAAYFTPLLTRMSSVRVIKGPAAIQYGPQTVGGAIDFITRPIPEQMAGALDLAAGEYGYTKAHGHVGWSNEQVGFLIEGVRLSTTGFAELPSGADTGSTRNEWMAKASYVVDPGSAVRNELALKVTYSDEVSNETYLGLSDADLRADPYRRYPASALDRMDLDRTSIVLSHVLDVPSGALTSGSFKIKTSAYRHVLERSWNKLNRLGGASVAAVLRAPDEPLNAAYHGVLTGEFDSTSRADTLYIGPNDRTLITQGVQSVLQLESGGGWLSQRLEAGIRLHNDSIRRLHTESGYLMTGGELVPDGEATLVSARNSASTTALALHLVDAISLHDLTLTPGIRVELMGFATEDRLTGESRDTFTHALMPGIGAYYGLSSDLGVLAGVYRGFSPPVPPTPQGGELVEPEYSINYEAGVRYASGPARAELIGFYNDYSNLTDVCTLSSGCLTESLDRQFDAGEAQIIGFEAFAAHDIPLGPLRLPISLAYTLTHGEFGSSFQSQDPIYGAVSKGDAMPYIPRHQLNTTVGLEAPRLGGAASLNYVAPMREEAGSEPLGQAFATDEQFWLDLALHGRVFGPLGLYANLRNVWGSANIVGRRPYGARVNAPRWFQVGAKLAF